MIVSISHKALRLFYEDANGSKLPREHLSKIKRILTSLDAISSEVDIAQLGSGIHRLNGDMKEYWSVKVSANYRIIFKFKNGDVYDVEYIDYH